MARSENDIYNAIIADKEANSDLDGLTSSSSFAVWRLLARIMAMAIRLHELLWDTAKADIQAIADAAVPGTPDWYVAKAKAFQSGDILQYNPPAAPAYAAIDVSKQIITRVALVQSKGGLLFKLAKGESPEPLSSDELDEFAGYMARIKFAGTYISTISLDADIVHAAGIIYYDPQYDITALQAAIDDAVNSYAAKLPFNGLFRRNAYIDAIQAVSGVIDIKLNTLEGKAAADASYTYIDVSFHLLAGYFEMSAGCASTFTFIPYV